MQLANPSSPGTPSKPVPYRVSYSGRVRQRLLSLAGLARDRGEGEGFLAALKELDRGLRLYPEFGDPLTDLRAEPGHVRIGVVRPLVVRYAVLEERRLVVLAALPVLLPKSSR